MEENGTFIHCSEKMQEIHLVIKIDPRFADAFYNRGIGYDEKGQYDWAISDFTKAIETDPGLAEAHFNRGVTYYFKKEYDKSWEDIEKAYGTGYQVPSEFFDNLRKASGRKDL
jgi:lipoprotein NlpI